MLDVLGQLYCKCACMCVFLGAPVLTQTWWTFQMIDWSSQQCVQTLGYMNMYEVNVKNVTLIACAMSWSQNDDMNPVSEP